MEPPPVIVWPPPAGAAAGRASEVWFQELSPTHATWCGLMLIALGGSVVLKSHGQYFALQGPGPQNGPWDPKRHSWKRLAQPPDLSTVSGASAPLRGGNCGARS